jgi:hypothetical protein
LDSLLAFLRVERVGCSELASADGLTFHVDNRSLTFGYEGQSVVCREGTDGGITAVHLAHQAWDDLTGQMLTLVGLGIRDTQYATFHGREPNLFQITKLKFSN